MVYQEKFVAFISLDGKVLREFKDEVYIPFGSEYKIGLKNLNTTKAIVHIYIDGKDVLDGNDLVVNPNSSYLLEGFMKNNTVSHKFKFIEKTSEIEEYRGNREDDGLIRIEYEFEKIKYNITDIYDNIPTVPYIPKKTTPYYPEDLYGPYNPVDPFHPNKKDVIWCSNQNESKYYSSAHPITQSEPVSVEKTKYKGNIIRSQSLDNVNQNEDGITVRGSGSNQKFVETTVGELTGIKHSLVIKLKGKKEEKEIVKKVFTKSKITCETCGRKNKSYNKYCYNCSTSLIK